MPEAVPLSDPRIGRIPVEECGEELIDMREVRTLRLDSRLADPEGNYARLRRGVLDRLVTAQTMLPGDLRLLIVEGYRPRPLQERYFQEQIELLAAAYPEYDQNLLHREASRYISPPSVAPHVAGAAVDLTLCTAEGVELPMGTDLNDTTTPACHMDDPGITTEARDNRRLLSTVLSTVGLINYPTEWWHWSYGDRYWAYATSVPCAHYGPVSHPQSITDVADTEGRPGTTGRYT